MRPHGAFILARYSTDNQNADSIEVQVGKCSEWCKFNNFASNNITNFIFTFVKYY